MTYIKYYWKSLLIYSSLLFVLVACNEPQDTFSIVGSKWDIFEEVNFLNSYEYCGLGQEIEFLNNDYFIYTSRCFAESPYGIIKVGYYKYQNDSIYFFNEYHSLTAQMKVLSSSENELGLIHHKYYLDEDYKMASKIDSLTLIR